jgi:sugar phosphate isomerase/epimerase
VFSVVKNSKWLMDFDYFITHKRIHFKFLSFAMNMKISRRHFIRKSSIATAALTIIPSAMRAQTVAQGANPVRLGGPVQGNFNDPADWVKAVKSLRYTAAYCPVQPGAPVELIKAFREEAIRNNIIISEVGAWNNTLDPDDNARKDAIKKNIDALHLADEVGARCCVNISGARGEIWDGPYAGNYAMETFDLIVENVRHIIDEVKPSSAFYTLEPMPYMLPDSPDSYLELIKAIDRKQFGAHLDPVNMISDPHRYFNNSTFLKECFSKLGKYIKSIHAKDILIMPELTLHLEERRPGLGTLNYAVFLQEVSKLKEIPFMLEHLSTQEEYLLAANYVRETGKKAGIEIAG